MSFHHAIPDPQYIRTGFVYSRYLCYYIHCSKYQVFVSSHNSLVEHGLVRSSKELCRNAARVKMWRHEAPVP